MMDKILSILLNLLTNETTAPKMLSLVEQIVHFLLSNPKLIQQAADHLFPKKDGTKDEAA